MIDEKSGVASECWFRCVDCQGWDLLLAVLRGRGPQAKVVALTCQLGNQ